ncbi:hypothetical protein ACVNS2_10920 [Paenibacillus caseinilyticus]|uniref:Uncharacterized protein n=1 Tax=Paenibacillus mucilaginosus K02 TaxID=997761 RepID=I0BFK1_9BACL|nr:hypothetical protein [Paenibacillus mucilaginosus]AFH61148.1 hypothetical protein B2K_10510 [Paenibacillus mucilaginosus K02]
MNNYQPPKLLEQIIKWEKDFSGEVEYLNNPIGLGLSMEFEDTEGYFCTPVDSFPFAWTGGDGIHYALLTDFGLIKDLNEAPVICISPMDSERTRLVARNLYDFFSLNFFDETKNLNSEYFDHDRLRREKMKVINEVQEQFNFAPIQNPLKYIQDIRLERSLRITTLTDDSLGVMPFPSSDSHQKETFLASIRNLQHSACVDQVVVERHAKELLQMGMTHEAESFLARMLLVGQ